MKIAIMHDDTCINTAVFADLETAKDFFQSGVWPETDGVAELPVGYGIGDTCVGGTWAKRPVEEPDTDPEALRAEKLAQVSAACEAAICAGVAVTLPDGATEQFSLTEKDQINLTNALAAVQSGAEGFPYHSDGGLCRMYSAEEITIIARTATAHILYHTTYCNHLNFWIGRAEDAQELHAITYGADLPEDLAANMAAILEAAT